MRDLLAESGSIFVQIGDENVHRVRAVLDEVFGEKNFVSQIRFNTTGIQSTSFLSSAYDHLLWYARNRDLAKYRQLYRPKVPGESGATGYTLVQERDFSIRTMTQEEKANPSSLGEDIKILDGTPLTSSGASKDSSAVHFRGRDYALKPNAHWKTHSEGRMRLLKADRVVQVGNRIEYKMFLSDFGQTEIDNSWQSGGQRGFTGEKIYVVQTAPDVIQRAVLMVTDPGDLVLDPTCGSGTTATVAEQWGRRWITIDTSRVALALARARVMGAKYPYYILADSREGHLKEGEITGRPPAGAPTNDDIRQGFIYDRAPHIMLGSIANNAEIDVIWEEFQAKLEPLRRDLNAALGKKWDEWDISREAASGWPDKAKKAHAAWWEQRIARQKKIDESIAKKADVELLYDRPYEDKSRIRVAGPFTVESLSPHRVVPSSVGYHVADAAKSELPYKLPKGTEQLNDFTTMILEHLKTSGVQQAKKADRITFTSISGWPGNWVAADGRFLEGEMEKRAAIFIGPEFGTVSRADLTAAAREALDARFDALIACGFNFEAHTAELNKLGPLPILKAKMNPELHMSEELKNTGAGNLFVVFGEPDIKWDFNSDGEIVVEVLGVDVFDPKTGDVRASGKDDIAAWFIDTDYNEESFFVRHAYFMGANDPYKSLKTALKAEIDEDAWATLYRDTSRPFPRPETGRFAVKVINHFGDEVMKVFAV
jgi:adenine-specific DNA-methyltransferase